LTGLIVFFALGLASSQSRARRDVVARFSDHAVISAALRHSLVGTVAADTRAAHPQLFGSSHIEPSVLNRVARAEQSPDLVLFDASGRIIASAGQAAPAMLGRLQGLSALVRTALRNRTPSASDVVELRGLATIQLAQPFQTASGPRVLVQGMPLATFSGFMSGFLAESALRAEASGTSQGLVIDDHGVTMARSAPAGGEPSSGDLDAAAQHEMSGSVAGGRYFVASHVADTPWVVVLTAPQKKLFASVSGETRWMPWVLFAAFGLVSVLALLLLIRSTSAQRAARDEAERASRAKSEFLSRMSHELRTPLNAVIGFSQLLQLDELDGAQRESVDQILKAGRHLLELINEVLDISRIESGTMSMSLEPVHLGSVLAEALSLIRPLADEARVSLRADPGELGDLHVTADRQRLKQVLINLLSNAVKYNKQDGQISVECTDSPDGRVQLAISDTGKGLTPEQLKRLFEPFDRLEETEIEGTGLGLALSLRLTEAMGGTIDADSEPRVGTTMRVLLERAAASGVEDSAVAEETAETGDAAPAWTILYIEDNLSNLKLVERVIERNPGIRLLPAMQGRLGVELAHQYHPDLLLLDLHLPDLHGREVLKQLKSDPATAQIPVVILSADATPRQVERLIDEGAADYLTKPIDVELLLEIITRTFEASPALHDAAGRT
jgi:signal transduction histidine kinase/ActR/RegA family two-component response regulator